MARARKRTDELVRDLAETMVANAWRSDAAQRPGARPVGPAAVDQAIRREFRTPGGAGIQDFHFPVPKKDRRRWT